MGRLHVRTRINDEPVEFLCDPRQTLLGVLRDELQLTGTKEGCTTGDCSACSVTFDGRLVCSCLVLGAEAEGHEIGTIEGLAEGERLHPLQQKFLEHAALQCGVCTPGFLVAARALLDRGIEQPAQRHHCGTFPAILGNRKIVVLVREGLEAKARLLGDGFDGDAPVRPFLRYRGCNGVVRSRLMWEARGLQVAQQLIDQDASAGPAISIHHAQPAVGEQRFDTSLFVDSGHDALHASITG